MHLSIICISVTIIKKRRDHQFKKVGETAEVWRGRGRSRNNVHILLVYKVLKTKNIVKNSKEYNEDDKSKESNV